MSKLNEDIFMPVEAQRDGFTIRSATAADFDFWNSVMHTTRVEYAGKLAGGCAFIITRGEEHVGLLYHATLWDSVPMLNIAFVRRSWRGRGAGAFAIDFWEKLMQRRGYKNVLVCVPSDMKHQHFFRSRGYADCGSLGLRSGEKNMPADLILAKTL